jgi:hypothetical protein
LTLTTPLLDVFYTNSRYAKVGGLPPHELNQLELQFLLLNNFTLMIPPEEMQKYGDRLLVYWQSNETEASEPESKHCREEQRERERTGRPAQQYRTDGTHTPAPAHAQAQPAQTHPAQPQAAGQASAYATPVAQASATAPATPMAPPAQLSRSASLPRHPPQVPQAQTDAVRGRERDRERPAVSFTSSGLAKAAPVASGF